MLLISFLAAACLPLISLGSIEDPTDLNKSKKIQIVYIKVPLVTSKLRNNQQNGINTSPNHMNGVEPTNGDKLSYSMGSSKPSYLSSTGYNSPNNNVGSGFLPANDYPSNNGGPSYSQGSSFTPYPTSSGGYNGGSSSGNYGGSQVSGTNKKPLFSGSSSSPSYEPSSPHQNSIVPPTADSPMKHQSAFPFPLNVNTATGSGYSPSGRGNNNNHNGQVRPTGFQGFDKNFNQGQRFNQGPVNVNNNNHGVNHPNNNEHNNNNNKNNPNFAFNYGNNYEKGQGFNGGSSLPLGLMGSSNGFLSNLKPSDGLRYYTQQPVNSHTNGLIKPMGSTGKLMKPVNVDEGLGSAYGAASTDPLPYGSNEADPLGPSYNPSDFFGPSATSDLNTGLDDFTGFGDMTFDNDALLNFGGMQPYAGDFGMEKNNNKKNKGYGSFMSSALSGLGSLGFLTSGNPGGSNGLTSSYNPMKGMAVAMSNTFPSFAGPKQPGNIGVSSASPSSTGGSSSSGFGGIRTRLTNLLSGRLPSLNLASLTGLGSLGSPGGLSGLGGMNSGLLGLFGL